MPLLRRVARDLATSSPVRADLPEDSVPAPGAPLPCQDAIPALPAVTDTGRDVDGDLRSYRNLLDCLAEVPEPRRRHGIRHWAAVVIAFAVAAVLAGADSVTAISEWSSDVPAEVLAALGAWTDRRGPRVPPSRSTFRRVLRRLDAQAVAAAFGTG